MTEEEKKHERYMGKVEMVLKIIASENSRYSTVPRLLEEDLVSYSALSAEEVDKIICIYHSLTRKALMLEVMEVHSDNLYDNKGKNLILPVEHYCQEFVGLLAAKGLEFALKHVVKSRCFEHPEYDSKYLAEMLFTYAKAFVKSVNQALEYGYPYELISENFWFASIPVEKYYHMSQTLAGEIEEWRKKS